MTYSFDDRARLSGKGGVVGALMAGTALACLAMPAAAQDIDPDDGPGPEIEQSEGGDEIVVTGIRGTIQNSIEGKRDNDLIVEVLSADEIGGLPALSIGEALETLTSAASHREQGGATEISLRGLGPFLSSTTINGRLASNGSGDRSVNFSQFPSELFNTLAIYKTQSASLIEGGVAGQIALETVAPLDYGRRRFQADFKLPYNPDNFNIDEDQRFIDFGYRATLSYVDQYDLGGFGDLGISVGYQRNETSNPEQEASVSNTIRACVLDPTDTADGVFDDGNCDTSADTILGLRDGSVTDDFVIARNSYAFRSNITDDERESFFAALQYRPSPSFELGFDFQYSDRLYREQRSDLGFVEGRRIDGPGDDNRLDFDLLYTETGALRQFTSEQRIEATSEYLQRAEEYYGGGIDFVAEVGDRFTLSGDLSYSQTQRVEEAVQVRFRTEDNEDITGAEVWPDAFESDGSSTDDRVETAVLIQQNGSEALNFFTQNFDVTNYDLFANDPRVRADLEQDRFNSIWGARLDGEYEMDGFLSSIMVGVRFQDLLYRDVPGAFGVGRFENSYDDVDDTGALAAANRECRTPFPETGFLSSVSGGNPLITNVDDDGNVIGTYNTFATFDALCIVQVLEREDPSGLSFDANGIPIFPSGDFDSVQNNDVDELTYAAYVQANFDGDLGNVPVRGNLGVRAVRTEVESTGFRTSLISVIDDTDPEAITFRLIEDADNLTSVTADNTYTKFLPSFNLTAELTPDILGRVAVYRALSRPDPSALGFGRTFSIATDEDTVFTSIEDALGIVTANGNPFTDPLMSWNGDVSLEWYPDEDSIFAVSAYYKSFNGGFEIIGTTESFIVDDSPVEALVRTVDTIDETSTIYGFEVSAAHRFTWLPAPLDGLGFKVGYNYAQSDFEFEDDTLGEIATLNDDGTITVVNGLIPPADIFGLSNHVVSAQAYYEIGPLEFQGVWKYRSDYFQQFVATPGRIRYVDDTSIFEARVSFELSDNVTFRLEGLNLFNEPRFDYRGAPDDFGAVSVYGPRYFAGVRFKF
ncbi:TonB-dependent receptor [Aurantiacibacter aquimixticola]|uniref:TonB-dependent receptor n=1 Tax=Aurantiacibacter aquimixticola TaxID=1958945 RepID=A0A419RW63_9SPHN|nr:TonB-dependent receptor [Aurantiacibacter aquimixticola]RJY10004.1 TonB-dependent receptor [Aurantiacibacter aquimixticola]